MRALGRVGWSRILAMSGVWLSVLLLLAASWDVAISLAARDEAEARSRAERDTANLAHTIAEQSARAIADTDRILQFVAFDIARFGAGDGRLLDVLREATRGSNLMFQLAFTDAQGDLTMTSVEGPAVRINLADRDHFRVHLLNPAAGLFISKPVFGRASGRWSIQLSRRINAPDGRFAGIVVASLDPFYFSRSFDALDVGRDGVVAMVGHDGVLRARSAMREETIGRDLSASPLYAAAKQSASGFLPLRSPIDGILRLTGFRAVVGYPLYVYVGFSETEFFAATRKRQNAYFAAAGAATLLLLTLGALTTWQDRTQRRARAAAERANDLKGAFLATISHELRTPMNGVLGMLSLLEDSRLSGEQTRQVGLARRSAVSLLALLDDLLDFSRLDAGKIVLSETSCDVRRLVGEIQDLLHPTADQKHVRLQLDVAPTVPASVRVDMGRLRQILFNLLGNAVKFTDAGHVKVRINRGAAVEPDRFLLEVDVEDTGIGIPVEVLPRLFVHFAQADNSVTRRYGGTGLGLAICRQLCTAMGGEISATSCPGRGSVFRFTVLCREDGSPDVGERTGPQMADVPPGLQILVVDDHAINRDVLKGFLECRGQRADTAADGAQALQMAAARVYDLVLMDIQMPGMDGLTVTKRIRGLPPPHDGVAIIAVTAQAQRSSRAECLAAGMDGLVTKPVHPDRLFAEIAAVMSPRCGVLAAEPPTPAPIIPDPVLLDTGQIEVLREALGTTEWKEAVESFHAAAAQEIGRIRQALAAGTEYASIGHALKGMALNMGAERLGGLAGQMETAPASECDGLCGRMEQVLAASALAMAAPAQGPWLDDPPSRGFEPTASIRS